MFQMEISDLNNHKVCYAFDAIIVFALIFIVSHRVQATPPEVWYRPAYCVDEDVVYVTWGGNRRDSNLRQPLVSAIDLTNGQVLWTFTGLGYFHGKPLKAGDILFVLGHLNGRYGGHALDVTKRGAVIWSVSPYNIVHLMGTSVLTSQGHALAMKTGAPLWQVTGWFNNNSAYDEQADELGCIRQPIPGGNLVLTILNGAQGKSVREYPLGLRNDDMFPSVLGHRGGVTVVSLQRGNNTELSGYDASQKKPIWTREIRGLVYAVTVRGKLHLIAKDVIPHTYRSIRLATGKLGPTINMYLQKRGQMEVPGIPVRDDRLFGLSRNMATIIEYDPATEKSKLVTNTGGSSVRWIWPGRDDRIFYFKSKKWICANRLTVVWTRTWPGGSPVYVWDRKQSCGVICSNGLIVTFDSSNGTVKKKIYFLKPLCVAAGAGDLETVKKLLGDGVNVNERYGQNATALDYAVNSRHDEIAELLRTHGGKRWKEIAPPKRSQEVAPTNRSDITTGFWWVWRALIGIVVAVVMVLLFMRHFKRRLTGPLH